MLLREEYVQVDEVKNIMVDNIEKVLERGEKIELLVDKTDNLRFQVSASSASCILWNITAKHEHVPLIATVLQHDFHCLLQSARSFCRHAQGE